MNQVGSILGGLGIFLVGLRMLGDGLQKIAGNRLRAILGRLTQNRISGVISGFLITCAAQSSSATTVLIVSFANAGLLNLIQAAGLVMGANIGTTLTAWIVSLFGFKLKISSFALPIIGLGTPLSFLSAPRPKHFSQIMVGFGLLFLGLAFLKSGVPNLKESPQSFAFLQQLTAYGFGSTLLFVAVGTTLTIIVQSSSAASAITLTLVANGWIGLDLAAAMILGENVGTTVTAQLAAIGANRNARRVAMFHTLFNVVGILWILPVIHLVLRAIQWLLPGDISTDILVATAQVALFHTLFNVSNTALLIGFIEQINRIVLRVIPFEHGESEGPHLKFLESGLLGTPELATLSARRALSEMVGVCQDMIESLKEVVPNPNKKLGKLVNHIKREEQRTDEMEEEIVTFCSRLARSETSATVGRDIARYLEMANNIERIGDHAMNLVLLAERRHTKRYSFLDDAREEIEEMINTVGTFIGLIRRALVGDKTPTIGAAKKLETKINSLRDQTRKRHAQRMKAGDVNIRQGLIYLDMMTNLEKIGDYCWNIHELDSVHP